MITADRAVKENREVFAVPSAINSLALSGTNNLIRKGEAKLVDNVEHILENFQMESQIMVPKHDFSYEERLVLEKIADGGKSTDEICAETMFPFPKVARILMKLNMDSVITEDMDEWTLV